MPIYRVLILAPHTDDGEFGCGGTISRLIEEGHEVYYGAFSIAEESVPEGFPKDVCLYEMQEAVKILGIPSENQIVFRFRVRHFPTVRQEILEEIIKLRDEIQPDIVFVPSRNDIHQDHQVITQEGFRAFKRINLFGYELPWNNIVFEARSFVCLEKRHIGKKVEALLRYKSQVGRTYLNEDFVWSLARVRGTQIEREYAEAFEVLRCILT